MQRIAATMSAFQLKLAKMKKQFLELVQRYQGRICLSGEKRSGKNYSFHGRIFNPVGGGTLVLKTVNIEYIFLLYILQ